MKKIVLILVLLFTCSFQALAAEPISISNITVTVGANKLTDGLGGYLPDYVGAAIIYWQSNNYKVWSKVYYGTSPNSLTSLKENPSLGYPLDENGSLELNGLALKTTYYYKIVLSSEDKSISTESSVLSFTTPEDPMKEVSVQLTWPLSNETLQAGETYVIKWNQQKIDLIDITYSDDPSTKVDIKTNIQTDSNSTSGTYSWTIPENFEQVNLFGSRSFKIKITGCMQAFMPACVVSESGTLALIPSKSFLNTPAPVAPVLPKITFSSPASNVSWKNLSSHNISWQVENGLKPRYVDLWLVSGQKKSNGNYDLLPITKLIYTDSNPYNAYKTLNTGSYDWYIPESMALQNVDLSPGGSAYSYKIELNPISYEITFTMHSATQEETANGFTWLMDPLIAINPGSYRIYGLLNDGATNLARGFSDYFLISNTTSTPTTTTPPATTPPTTTQPTTSETQFVQAEKSLVTRIDTTLTNRLNGYILLQVQEHGEAWYVDSVSDLKYYLPDGSAAYSALRKFGLGITNADLAKIPVGIETRFQDIDTDADGLPDKLEEGLGTNPQKADSDGDGYLDGDEVKNGFNPLGAGSISVDSALVNRLKGRIVLQVQSRGEAWYINPKDGKRYYMKDGGAAYQIMRFLSLGITNSDLRTIPVGSL